MLNQMRVIKFQKWRFNILNLSIGNGCLVAIKSAGSLPGLMHSCPVKDISNERIRFMLVFVSSRHCPMCITEAFIS